MHAVLLFCPVTQVITTPVGTSFDQLRAADEAQYKFDRCCKALEVRPGSTALCKGTEATHHHHQQQQQHGSLFSM